jgi:hypothetical protein
VGVTGKHKNQHNNDMAKQSRPDFSFYLGHFTKEEQPDAHEQKDNPALKVTEGKSAFEKLKSMLADKKIIAGTLPWNKKNAVCLTECPWSSLVAHSKVYSPYAIGFSKAFIFGTGGAPAFYVRADQFDRQQWDGLLYTFTTPFWPSYRPKKKNLTTKFKTIDYSHEREWRVPHDLSFDYEDIEFVILNRYKDLAELDKDIKDAIGREKFFFMEMYEKIETLWPVHNIGQ